MQTRWHVPPGKKIKNVKIEDRMKELHISVEKYEKITAHLTRVSKVRTATEAEERRRRRMKEESDNMTQNWPDAIRKETVVVAPTRTRQDVEEENMEKYMRVKKEQDQDRDVYVNKMRHSLFLKEDFPKAITSAVLFGEVLHEREKQTEIAKVKKDRDLAERVKEYKHMLDNCARLKQEEEEAAVRVRQKNAIYAAELAEQVKNIQERKMRDENERIREELIQHERAKVEWEKIQRIQQNKRNEKNKRDQEALVSFLNKKMQRQEAALAYNKQCDVVTDINQQTRYRLNRMIRQKERDIIAEHQKMLPTTPIEDKRKLEVIVVYDRAAAKREQAEKLKEEEKEKKRQQMKEERIADHKQHLRRRAEKEKHKKEYKKFEMMQRFRAVEKQKERRDRDVIREKQGELRAVLLDQMKTPTMDELVKHETEAAFKCMMQKYGREDTMYLKYAEDAKNQCKALGWNPVAVDKVVKTYRERTMGESSSRRCAKAILDTDSTDTVSRTYDTAQDEGACCVNLHKQLSCPY